MFTKHGILTMLPLALWLSIAHADGIPEIEEVLQPGDSIKISEYYCIREDLLRGFFRLLEVSDEKSSLKIMHGTAGLGACNSNKRFDEAQTILQGIFVRAFSKPITVRLVRDYVRARVIEVRFEGRQIFTYLTDLQVRILGTSKELNASAATN
ncbi:hypothetical protein C4556_01050 [Candidatus Parcubacteria bacterium]|nr:MAG: hypothetical protein C4556_01050 [Candidatus Parcubacteria bacterium]